MELLSVCAPVFYPDTSKCGALLRSSSHYGIEVHPYGVGEKWRGFFDSKLVGLLEYAKTVRSKYVICVDAVDSVVVAGEKEIVDSFHVASRGSPILLQQDRFCFPYWGIKDWFDKNLPAEYKETKPFGKYICAGCVMGEREALIDAISALVGYRTECPPWMPGYDDDQGWWTIAKANGFFDLGIDYDAMVSICLNRCRLSWFKRDADRIIASNSRPCVLHFGGISKGTLMSGYLKSVGRSGEW